MCSTIECYSVRQLSPFVGNIQVVEADYCRALSADGRQWQIQASCETHQQLWKITDDAYLPRRYVLYGSWNKQHGLSSLPLDPMLDVPDLQHINNTLIKTLQNSEISLPFAQRDNYECWLIQQHTSLPLALVASVINQHMIPHIQDKPWQAMPQQEKLDSLPEQLTSSDIAQLESSINQQARQFLWFKRLDDGSGISIADASIILSADNFPELLINVALLPESIQTIATHFINWQSPRLLSLQWLCKSTRQQLEQAAQHYAVQTSKRLSIYPQPLNDKIHNKIMVELKIRGY